MSLTAALPEKAKPLAGTRVDGASAELALPRDGENKITLTNGILDTGDRL